MKSRRLEAEPTSTWVLAFDPGDEVISTLTAFAREQALGGARFSAIGAFTDATLGFFDRDRRDYLRIEIAEQVEVLSLLGNFARGTDGPKVHAHVVLGKRDGSAVGGHLLTAHVWPTLELILSETPRSLWRRHDAETGLPLLDPKLEQPPASGRS